MKHLFLVPLLMCCLCFVRAQSQSPAKSQANPPPTVAWLEVAKPTLITLKDINANIGKYVKIVDVVYRHRVLDSVEAIALGGVYPNVILTVILYGKAFDKLKAIDIDGKTISVSGTIVVSNGDNQLYLSDGNNIDVL